MDRNLIQQESLNIAGSVIAVGLVGILAFMAWALVYAAIPPDNREPLNMLLGILSTQVSIVVGFFFGTSYANKRQAETIDKQADTIKATTTAALPQKPAITLPAGEQVTVAADDPDAPPQA